MCSTSAGSMKFPPSSAKEHCMSRTQALLVALAWCLAVHVGVLQADFQASDPGVRPDLPNVPKSAGGMLDGLTAGQKALFIAGLEDFAESDTIASGLGPRMNLDSCGGCHQAPAVGGSSPAVNPQVAFATVFGARNAVPYFVGPSGPVREARFKYYPDGTPDGGVHALFERPTVRLQVASATNGGAAASRSVGSGGWRVSGVRIARRDVLGEPSDSSPAYDGDPWRTRLTNSLSGARPRTARGTRAWRGPASARRRSRRP